MEEKTSALKRKLMNSWELMRTKYPVVINAGVVKDDPIKDDFLKYIDGLKSADEIRSYFTLESSEAHLIFADLLNAGAVRFLENTERLAYLKRQHEELFRNLQFLKTERDRLSGEEKYLRKQIGTKSDEIKAAKQEIPKFEEMLVEIEGRLKTLGSECTDLWDSNLELVGLFKDIKSKNEKFKKAFDELDYKLPRIIKKKMRITSRIKKTNERLVNSTSDKSKLEWKMLVYGDTLDEVM